MIIGLASWLLASLTVAEAPQSTVVYLNFDGGTLSYGSPDDARTDTTSIPSLVGDFAPYGGVESQRAAVMQAVAADWAAYDVVLTDERPTDGHYVMSMIGPTERADPGVLGVAPLDCGDAIVDDVTFAFHWADDGYGATATAATVSQELGHSFGLEHVEDPADIMHPVNLGGDPSFVDACIPIVSEKPWCRSQHEDACGTPDEQSSHRELLAALGPRRPGGGGPELELLAPVDDERFEVGATISVRVDAPADFAVQRLQLYVDGRAQAVDETPPFGFDVHDVDEGTWELFVEARDDDGRVAFSPAIIIFVGASDQAREDGGALPPGVGTSRGTPESGCRIDPSRTRDLPLLLLAALFVRRR